MTKLNIFDCDGVLVDSSHRFRVNPETGRIDLNHWRANQHLALKDTLLETSNKLFQGINCQETLNIIATARVLDNYTQQYFTQYFSGVDYIIGRRDEKDTRKGVDLKSAGIIQFLEKLIICPQSA